MAVLKFALGKAAIANHHAVRNTDEFGIGEFHAGSRIAIVEQYLEPRIGQLGVQRLGRFPAPRRFFGGTAQVGAGPVPEIVR